MARAAQVNYLKLVPASTDKKRVSSRKASIAQPTLFPMSEPGQMIFINFAELSAEDFISLLENVRPTCVIDVRPIPRFDIGRFNRKMAFQVFQQNQIKYFDIAGLKGIYSKRDAHLNPALLIDFIETTLEDGRQSINGPLVFLFDEIERISLAAEVFPRALKRPSKKAWKIYIH